jgi:hypothetical protein
VQGKRPWSRVKITLTIIVILVALLLLAGIPELQRWLAAY